MTNEDFQQRTETLLNLQAQSDARLGKLEEIVTRLANASLERITKLEDTMDALVQAQIRTESTVDALGEKLSKLTEAQTQLTEAQAHTDQKLNVLIDIIIEGRNGRSQQ